jgi:colicin import membrane protein
MSLAAERIDFAPAPPPGMLRALVLALLAHALLLTALAWGVNWKHKIDTPAIEAELWSAVPQQAAPSGTVANESSELITKAGSNTQVPTSHNARISDNGALNGPEKSLFNKSFSPGSVDSAVTSQAPAEQKSHMNQEGTSSLAAAAVQATEKKILSSSYISRARSRVLPHIAFQLDMDGNPEVEVEIEITQDGKILSRRIVKSSGNIAWDESVLKAVDKTRVLPRDVDGESPPKVTLSFAPKG